MFRVAGMFGLGLLFLAISPGLRGSLMGQLDSFGTAMEEYSPISWVGLSVVVLFGVMLWINRARQPR